MPDSRVPAEASPERRRDGVRRATQGGGAAGFVAMFRAARLIGLGTDTSRSREADVASRRFASCVALAVFSVAVLATPTAGAAPALTRNPYLTDATATSVRVNWATVSTGTAKVVTWGQAGTGCSQYAATATGTPF